MCVCSLKYNGYRHDTILIRFINIFLHYFLKSRLSRKQSNPDLSICWFPWYKYSHSPFQATNMTSLNRVGKRSTVAHHYVVFLPYGYNRQMGSRTQTIIKCHKIIRTVEFCVCITFVFNIIYFIESLCNLILHNDIFNSSPNSWTFKNWCF